MQFHDLVSIDHEVTLRGEIVGKFHVRKELHYKEKNAGNINLGRDLHELKQDLTNKLNK